MDSWKNMLAEEMKVQCDFGEVIHCTLSDEEMAVEFEDDFGVENGKPFTAWTAKRVYFPVCYDGREWVGSVPSYPCDEPTEHIGGG